MCNNPLCKFINIIEIYDGVKVCLHYNDDDEPILIQYWDENNCFERCFVPKTNIEFKELTRFPITIPLSVHSTPSFPSPVSLKLEDIKNEHFDLTDIINLEDEN